ncbi:Rne/Rng family ribonuclease [Pelagibacterales bacterium]|nr:Rne/Rng family ribonuclease [Pelagibacterales bacterium]
MASKLLIDGSQIDQTKVALVGDFGLEDFEFESNSQKHLKGNIYLGKISRIEPSLQAAFVDIGSEKNGFLAFGEIHPNYFQIPIADREALLKAEADQQDLHNSQADNSPDSSNEVSSENTQVSEDDLIKNTENDILNRDEGLSDNESNVSEDNESNVSEDNESNVSEDKEIIIEPDDLPSIEKKSKPNNRHSKSQKINLRKKLFRSYKIQEVIKNSQLILVQVVKEERGNKGAALTSYISLAGKYTVLMPNSTKTKGISRKIASSEERQKLKTMIEELKLPIDMGLIVRTAGLNKTKNEIKNDVEILKKLWNNIVGETTKDTTIAPALVHEEGNLIRRAIRDIYTKEMKNIFIEGSEAFKETKKYVSQLLPSCAKYVKEYKNKIPIFAKHNVESELIKMFDTNVHLKSGGYLVINPTEALVAIDVNSGSATKERNIEKTAIKTNLEAAEEISKQIKIRDLSGLIVIDFIDMYEMRNNRLVEKKIKEMVKLDRARIQVNRISQFGLMELSRQRLRQSFIEWKCTLSIESCAQKIIGLIKQNSLTLKTSDLRFEINPVLSSYIKAHHEKEILSIKEKYNVKFTITQNLMLENDTIIFNDLKDPKKKKKTAPNKKKKVVKSKVPSKKMSEAPKVQKKTDPSPSKISSKVDTKKPKAEKDAQDDIKPVAIKKARTGPKKTGWWSQ